ncbi:hypothetical protein FA15DRAFT_666307 [Coprinopsis marcescibilis]|uniref:DUF7918 domain-containing protein n=1 Tax=Coprinopsis marcescibilis TaxID=230819 RepID=A0A5C3L4B6_COPMA|nr:hypothetical protein FA15DRAFT_666307 [Coprinopsis marcescibilis]
MPEFVGFDVGLEIEGKRLDEFGTELDLAQKKKSCWVACEAGKDFKIVINPKTASRTTNYLFGVTMDGALVQVRGRRYDSTDSRARIELFEEIATINAQTDEIRSFRFSTVSLTDDDAYLGAAPDNIGVISVQVHTVEHYTRIPNTGDGQRESDTNIRLHERSKKGISHCVGSGEGVKQSKSKFLASPINCSHLATFTFKYRSMDILIANGVAPSRAAQRRSAAAGPSRQTNSANRQHRKKKSPTTGEVIEILDSDDDAGPSSPGTTKRSRAGHLHRSQEPKRVKREPKADPGSLFKLGEVIDLTLD